ncbi:hypothetical protein ANN_17440 [Periplaneta americana]|uniref:Uncharacterized protein n=1 Tax=Periplaneta americana TaxID=6978 RepID=A0ABQ8SUC8_PERAM|nr:hypothetical protein ANN_17440 [Periplaneta americana]
MVLASCLGLALRNVRWFESSWGEVNRHNVRILDSEPSQKIQEFQRGSPKRNVWCALLQDMINLVVPPLFAITAAICQAYSPLVCIGYPLECVTIPLALSWTMKVGRISQDLNHRSNSSERCSMGLRSELCAGTILLRWLVSSVGRADGYGLKGPGFNAR